MSLSIIANVVSRYAASTRTAGLKEVTFKEFQQALANAGWPSPEYAHTKRTMDAYYKDRGTEVAHKTQILTRGKVTQEHFYANPDYLGEGNSKEAATNIVVLDDDDLEGLDEKAKKAWKGYTYKMTYEVVSPESAEEGDAEDRGWEEEGSEPYDTLEEVLKAVDDKSWLEWSSSSPDGKRDWIISQAEEDYSSGNNTTYHLWIERKDGKPLGKEELAYIKKSLRLH